MMRKLLNSVMRWFVPATIDVSSVKHVESIGFDASLRRKLLTAEYVEIVYELKSANNLIQLLDIRKRIQQFQKLVLDNKEYSWGKQYIIDLHRIWKIQYTRWKRP